jgi:hypothetical protein
MPPVALTGTQQSLLCIIAIGTGMRPILSEPRASIDVLDDCQLRALLRKVLAILSVTDACSARTVLCTPARLSSASFCAKAPAFAMLFYQRLPTFGLFELAPCKASYNSTAPQIILAARARVCAHYGNFRALSKVQGWECRGTLFRTFHWLSSVNLRSQ